MCNFIMNIPRIITDNPFRVLGITSNAGKKELLANKSRISAYSRLGKSVSFSLDLTSLLPPPKRQLSDVQAAEALINRPEDRLKYALFWFMSSIPSDIEGIEWLAKGNVSQAESYFWGHRGVSSSVNLACVEIIRRNIEGYLNRITPIVSHQMLRENFIREICGENISFGEDFFIESILSTLIENFSLSEVSSAVDELDSELFREKFLSLAGAIPLQTIENALSRHNKNNNNDPEISYQEGMELARECRQAVNELRALHLENELTASLLLNKLAEKILNYAEAYFWNSNSGNKLYSARNLLAKAKDFAASDKLKEKCDAALAEMEEGDKCDSYADRLIKETDAFDPDNATLEEIEEFVKNTLPIINELKEATFGLEKFKLYAQSSNAVVTLAVGAAVSYANKNCQPNRGQDIRPKLKRLLDIFAQLVPLPKSSKCQSWFEKNYSIIKGNYEAVGNAQQRSSSPGLLAFCLKYWWVFLIIFIIMANA